MVEGISALKAGCDYGLDHGVRIDRYFPCGDT
jgi:hypothetical protein